MQRIKVHWLPSITNSQLSQTGLLVWNLRNKTRTTSIQISKKLRKNFLYRILFNNFSQYLLAPMAKQRLFARVGLIGGSAVDYTARQKSPWTRLWSWFSWPRNNIFWRHFFASGWPSGKSIKAENFHSDFSLKIVMSLKARRDSIVNLHLQEWRPTEICLSSQRTKVDSWRHHQTLPAAQLSRRSRSFRPTSFCKDSCKSGSNQMQPPAVVLQKTRRRL